jgi:hypothetical protein
MISKQIVRGNNDEHGRGNTADNQAPLPTLAVVAHQHSDRDPHDQAGKEGVPEHKRKNKGEQKERDTVHLLILASRNSIMRSGAAIVPAVAPSGTGLAGIDSSAGGDT